MNSEAMKRTLTRIALLALCGATAAAAQPEQPAPPKRTMADVLAASQPSDWRTVDPANTLYLELAAGRVIIELAPQFAPNHVRNILQLTSQGFYDGLAINRVQDNFVVQWGDAENSRPIGKGQRTLPAEFTRTRARELNFTRLPDADGFAPEVGFVDGFPAGRDVSDDSAWLAHCYAMVGVGRDNTADSGGGTELYVVIGHAPRQLDRNITVIGRVLRGMDLLASLPRGTGAMGFYERAEQRVKINAIRRASDVPQAERTLIEALRTNTPTFAALIEARRNRSDDFYLRKAGYIDLCNVPLPVRDVSR
jgi:peptidylprolyl isomerase